MALHASALPLGGAYCLKKDLEQVQDVPGLEGMQGPGRGYVAEACKVICTLLV